MQAFLPKAKIQASGFVLAPVKTQTDRGTRPGHASYAVGPCCLHLARAGPWGGVPGWVHVLLFTYKLTHQVTFYYFFFCQSGIICKGQTHVELSAQVEHLQRLFLGNCSMFSREPSANLGQDLNPSLCTLQAA